MATSPADDYYTLLGVDAGADGPELRRAWRRLALRWHPDRAGSEATATFQRIQAAYTVLSDPRARAAYDRRRGVSVRNPVVRSHAAPSTSATGPSTSPAATTESATAHNTPPAASNAAPAAARRRAPGVMLHRLSGSLNTLLACGVARQIDGEVIELLLNAREVMQGGMATISMRVPVRCPSCTANATEQCARCGTKRTVDELFSAWLAVPPAVADGAILSPSVPLRGMVRRVSFRVRYHGAT